MADNQSKNLPKADRQALNEVGQPLECPTWVLGPVHYLGHNELQPGSGFFWPHPASPLPTDMGFSWLLISH